MGASAATRSVIRAKTRVMPDANPVVTALRRLRIEADRVSLRLRDASRRRRHAGCEFEPIFVAGAIGSGTSLLAASLSQRLSVAGVALESARDVRRSSCLWIDRVARFPSVDAYAEALAPRADWDRESAREALQDLYRAKADDSSLGPFVDKGPNTNLVRAAFLAELFPTSPFVLIFRDPVANVEGFRRKWRTFAQAPLEDSVRFWERIHARFLEQAEAFPERVTTVEYEALVAGYEVAIARLSERLGVPLAARQRPVEARAEGQGKGLRGVEGGRIRIVRDANEGSYATLDPGEIAHIREVLGPLYQRLRERARASGFALDERSD